MKILNLRPVAILLFAIGQLVIFTGCAEYERWRNGPPEINTFSVPKEVNYGETTTFRVGVSDPEDDPLTYLWNVSEGTLTGEMGPEIQWTAPKLSNSELAPDRTVTVYLSVRGDGEEAATESASIVVFSKSYRVANALSGRYELVRTQVAGETVVETGLMRLTTTTFTREFQNSGDFLFGSYKLIEPFDGKKGTIYWFSDESSEPTVTTYTWDGELLVIFSAGTATGHVYQKWN